MNLNTINPLVLAYIGDAVYEVEIRKYLIMKKINKVNDLQKESLKYVSAVSQSLHVNKLISNDMLSQDEIDVYKRARNSRVNSHPSNTDIVTYKQATGFEAVFGYLYLNDKNERIKELISLIVEE